MSSKPGSNPSDRFDAVLIGSGINSLVAGATLAKAGWSVAIFEREERLGGAIYTAPIGDERFKHEYYSLSHAQFTTGPAYAFLREDLEARGLKYAQCSTPAAVVTPDGGLLTLHQDMERNIGALEACAPGDGQAFAQAMGAFFEGEVEYAFGLQAVDVPSVPATFILNSLRRKTGGAAGVGAWSSAMTRDASSWLSETFKSPQTRALFAPWSEHLGLGPDAPMSAFTSRALIFMQAAAGSTMPVGGGSELVKALIAIIEDGGGQVVAGTDVTEILVSGGKARGVRLGNGEEVLAKRAVLANVAPQQLYQRLIPSESADPELTEMSGQLRQGLSAMQVMFSLKKGPSWNAGAEAAEAAIINFTGGVDSVSKAYNEALRGLLPERPTLAVGQPMAVDPQRGPDGSWMLWVQLLEVPGQLKGDAAGEIDTTGGWTEAVRDAYADRIEAMLAENWKGFDKVVLERKALSPADLEQSNINLVDGALQGGESTLTSLFLGRPFPGRPSHKTSVKGLWHIGAFTRPGGGLGARSGFKVAQYLSAPRGPRGIGARANAGRD